MSSIYFSSSRCCWERPLFWFVVTMLLRLIHGTTIQGFVGTQACYNGLLIADADLDRKVDAEEYVIFVQFNTVDGSLDYVQQFSDLPLLLQSNFFTLACLCRNEPGASADCCIGDNAHIRNTNAFPGEVPSPEDMSYLYLVCWLTETAIQRIMNSMGPTQTPSMLLTAPPSTSPSAMPTTNHPTNFPTSNPTNHPTQSPSVIPTTPPTDSPTPAPSVNPSQKPSSFPSSGPTDSPSLVPSVMTLSPSATPSDQPTQSPSSGPTPSPTPIGSASPTKTFEPTEEPTLSPSGTPTLHPSSFPSVVPSPSPTVQPTFLTVSPGPTPITDSPSENPSPSPTVSPSVSPSNAPSEDPVDVVANVTYQIAITNGVAAEISHSDYVPELIVAMNVLAVQIEQNFDGQRRLQKRQFQRKLVVGVVLPTQIEGATVDNVPDTIAGISVLESCPVGTPTEDRCEEVTSTVGISISDDEDPQGIREDYEEGLAEAIDDGTLQRILLESNPNTPIKVLGTTTDKDDGIDTTPAEIPANASPQRLSFAATAGVSAAAVVMVAFLLAIVFMHRRQDKDDEIRPVPLAADVFSSEIGGAQADPADAEYGTLGAAKQSYDSSADGHPQKQSLQAIIAAGSMDDDNREPKSGQESSSQATSGGWSSHYSPSVNSASSGDDLLSPHFHLADIASDSMRIQDAPEPLADLDDAMRAGDWAAVGASAAILAAASSDSVMGGGTSSDSQSYTSGLALSAHDSPVRDQLDVDKAIKLDKLVNDGDWEGVILAAAEFEKEDTKRAPRRGSGVSQGSSFAESRGSSAGASSSRASVSLGSLDTSTGPRSRSTASYRSRSTASYSETPTKRKRYMELRNEIEALVEKVVPEEIDHVDEMMLQFKGREEELVETLRTMQERAIAAKAREAGRRQAKRDAKEAARQGNNNNDNNNNSNNPSRIASQSGAIFVAADETSNKAQRPTKRSSSPRKVSLTVDPNHPRPPRYPGSSSSSPSGGGASGSSSANASLSVYAAASSDSDSTRAVYTDSGTAASSEQDVEHHRKALMSAIAAGDWEAVSEAAAILSDADSSKPMSTLETMKSGSSSERKQNRNQELSALIQAGDWTGVVLAASRYNDADRMKSEAFLGTVENENDEIVQRQQRLKEEKHALEQADMWMEIAKQSKNTSMEDSGAASDATDWAIARSRQKMEKEKPDKSPMDGLGDDEEEV